MKKVLIVEDDKKISMALTIRLKSKGYEVLTAFDALSGVSVAVKNRPDMILLDVMMPAGGGFSVAERLRALAQTAMTPIIFLTASKRPGLEEKAEELSAVAFFEKPYDAESLLKTIDETLGGADSP